MSDIRNVDFVRNLFQQDLEEDVYMELEELCEGDQITFEKADVPEGWVLTVVDESTQIDYDSYGYGSSNGYIVFSVSDGTDSVTYKLPGGYSSYEGWDWDFAQLAIAERKEKIVTTWEWTNV